MIEFKKLCEPGLGPIIGHTTATSARLWIKAFTPESDHNLIQKVENLIFPSDTRYLGLIAVTHKAGKAIKKPEAHLFRLRREFDTTGFFDLGGGGKCLWENVSKPLEPATAYTVKMGVVHISDPHAGRRHTASVDLKTVALPANWLDQLNAMNPETNTAHVTTCHAEPAQNLRFFMGSCRYPGILWKEKESDRIFHGMHQHMCATADDGQPAMSLMVGDQIYADTIHRTLPLGLADSYAEFQERYNQAFSSPHLRRMLRHLPHYMILDDHEIEDNWHQSRLHKDPAKRRIFNLAIGAYRSHQWIHSPRNFEEKLYYSFECNGFPFFVMDLRTEHFRHKSDLNQNHLMGRPSNSPLYPAQLDILLQWLVEQQKTVGDRPKFLVSTLQFLPNKVETVGDDEAKLNEDSWPSFPQTRGALIDTIVKNNIQNVVFLCGDVHCHSTTEINFSGRPGAEDLRAFSITASAFYWPWCFADGDPKCFVHDSAQHNPPDTFKTEGGVSMDYKSRYFVQDDNFCDIQVNHDTITVRAISKKGKPLQLPDLTKIPKGVLACLRGDETPKIDVVSQLKLKDWSKDHPQPNPA